MKNGGAGEEGRRMENRLRTDDRPRKNTNDEETNCNVRVTLVRAIKVERWHRSYTASFPVWLSRETHKL